MIKYGTHCYIFTERWSDDTLEVLDTAHQLGLDFLEIAVGDDVVFTPALTRQRAQALGMELVISPGGEWPVGCDLSAEDPDDRACGLAWHKHQVALGAEVGAVAYTGALYGHPGTVKRRVPPADEHARTAEGLRELAEYGAQYGMEIVLEPMSHFRTHMVNTPAQLMRMTALVDHDNLRVLLDTYHLVTEIRDYAQAVYTTRDKLWGLHACENDRGVPGGGLVPWDDIFNALHAIGFDGYILFETYNSSIGDFAYRRGMFHNVCPDGPAFVREGLAFLEKGLQKNGAKR